MEELPDYSSWSSDRIDREYNYLSKMTLYTPIGGLILCFVLLFLSTGCSGTWVWQKDYPKHRTMSFKCPRWNYNEAYDELHHIYTTKQHEPINVNTKKK
jgi:tryptophan-rich sensory protein